MNLAEIAAEIDRAAAAGERQLADLLFQEKQIAAQIRASRAALRKLRQIETSLKSPADDACEPSGDGI